MAKMQKISVQVKVRNLGHRNYSINSCARIHGKSICSDEYVGRSKSNAARESLNALLRELKRKGF